MYRNHSSYKPLSEQFRQQFIKSGNSLGIGNPSFIWDQKKGKLVLYTDATQMIGSEIRALLKGNRLILEAPLLSSINKPFRTHLLEQKFMDEIEAEFKAIGVSEALSL